MSETRYEWAVEYDGYKYGQPATIRIEMKPGEGEGEALTLADGINASFAAAGSSVRAEPIVRTITVGDWRRPA